MHSSPRRCHNQSKPYTFPKRGVQNHLREEERGSGSLRNLPPHRLDPIMPFSSDSEEEFDLDKSTGGEGDGGEASGACSDSDSASYSGSSSDSDARSSGEESDYEEEENKSNFSNKEEGRGKSVKKQARTKTTKTIEVRQQVSRTYSRLLSTRPARSNTSFHTGDLPEEKPTRACSHSTGHVSICRRPHFNSFVWDDVMT